MPVSVMTLDEVKDMCCRLKKVSCKVHMDREAGTVQAYDKDVCVYYALEKGRGGLWICQYANSNRINWSNPCLEVGHES